MSYSPHKILLVIIFIGFSLLRNGFAQNVAINTSGNPPNASALLDMTATNKGLLIPRVTLCQRTTPACASGMLDVGGLLPAAAQGLLVYQTDAGGDGQGFYYNTSATTTPAWTKIFGGATGGIYAGSGSLTADPTTVTMGANNLAFTSTVIDGFSIDGTTFSVDASANSVGIGTASPSQKLDISGGNIEIGSAGYGVYFRGATNATNSRIYGAVGNTRLFVRAEDTDNVGQWASYGLFLPQDVGYGLYVTGGAHFNYNDLGDEVIVENGSGEVGIGTLTPSYNIHIAKNNDAAIYLQADEDNVTETDNAFIKFSQDGGGVQGILGTVGTTNFDPENVAYTGALDNGILFGTTTAFPLQLGTNDNVRLTILSGGNVGIGTTNPSTKLDVVGVLELSNTTPTDPGSDIVRLGDGGADLRIQTNYGWTDIGANNGSWSHFYTDRARYYFDKGITANTGLIGSYDENLSLQTSGTTRITVLNSNGYVGILNTSPVEELDVTGDIAASGTAYWGSSGTRTETKNDAGALGGRSGYFQTSAPAPAANWPTGAASWWHLLETRHSNTANNYSMQIAGSFFNQDFWVRKTNNSASTAWAQLITTANIGSYGDNLGNHTATVNLEMANFEIDDVNYVDITAGTGLGIRFWSSNSYAINMGNTAEYRFGPVTDYSIKMNMNSTAGRGWTWGIDGAVPVGALSNTGNYQIAGDYYGKSVNGAYSSIYRMGGIFFTWDSDSYGSNTQHSIRSTYGDTYGDEITLNSFNHIRFNIDANSNDATSYFEVGQHTTGTGNIMMRLVSPSGNLGIGTTAPSSRLHVSGGTASVDALIEADTDNIGEGDQPSLTFSQDGGAVTGKVGYFSSTNDMTVKNVYAGALNLGTSNVNRITIESGGDVGIGTTAPTTKLHVSGQVRITGGTPASGQVLTASDATGLATWEPVTGSVVQGMTTTLSTSEAWMLSNNTGSYSNTAGAGYTTGTWQDVPNTSATRSKTAGNIIKVTWSARWEIDSWNYYTSEMIWFRILRGATVIATTAVYTSGGVAAGGNYYFTDGNVSLTVYDTGAPTGSSTWKVQYWLTNQWSAQTERVRIGERYMVVTELEP